jgi:eukaryotic-like serine/threonine-protein kinase
MLDDKYRIERLLAIGGMGAVYLGMHVGLRKRVAIKVLNPQLNSAPMLERFHREAITASQIGHEGIAQVTDLGTSTEGEPFLVMEYLEGESLANRLKATGPLPIEDACELGCAILSPLAAAHHAGIIHRDLKPDNVFLVRQSRGEMVKLLDFGISRAKGQDPSFRLTTTGLILGTPYYMSPEQARGDSEVTIGADLYSFGVMLYEMLIGVVPIRAENYNQLMYRVMTGEYTWPRQLRRDLPEALEQIIVRAMALAPTDRPSSAHELEAALMPFCRQVFRDAATGRLSAPGLPFRSSTLRRPDALVPPTAPGRPGAGDPATERNAHPSWPQATGPGSPSVPGVSGRSGVTGPRTPMPPVGTSPAPRSRTAVFVLGLAIAVVGIVIAVVVGTRGDSPVATGPAATASPVTPQATATPPPATAPPAATPAAGTVPAAPPAHAEPTAAPQHADEPAAPPKITLRLAIEPAGATITLDDQPVTGPELVVARDARQHHLRITAAGYVPDDETVSFDESQRLVVQLKKAAVPGRGRTRKDRPTERPEKIESQSPYDN